jgi:heme/copper-type cytochrome/quinol oxidase subunit 4
VKIYNSYILTVSLFLLLTTIVLLATGQNSLDTFFTVYVIEALAITELYVHMNNKARQGLTYVSTILFGGFAIALCLQIISILA